MTTACAHRIRLEPNGNGRITRGVCRLCGYERDYSNIFEDVVKDTKGKPQPMVLAPGNTTRLVWKK